MMLLKHQRGAMFGLDARIALAILAGLSLVTGYYMSDASTEARARGLVKETDAIRQALKNIQQDLRTNIHQAGVADDDEAFTALYDPTPLDAAFQARWQGPYIDFNRNTHPDYGTMRIYQRLSALFTDSCTTGVHTSPLDICMLYFYIEGVPLPVIERYDDLLEPGAATPATQGHIQWDELVPDSGQYGLRVRLMVPALPY